MRLGKDFFTSDALTLAPLLLGKELVRQFDDGRIERFIITEVEAYCGEEDLACHASKGRTKRTEVMYHAGGKVYVYLIYGIYWMLNFVCGEKGHPQAVLIRGLKDVSGPGRVGKVLKLDRSFYGEDIFSSKRIWVDECFTENITIQSSKRIGVDYAGEIWGNKLFRFFTSV
jgi:DNA-3-methyladenine glycosylase